MKKKRRTRSGALPQGRLPGGRAGAHLIDQELRAWSTRLTRYLDRRTRSKPITETEIKRHLMERPLNLGQARRAVLGGILAGHLAVDLEGRMHDGRALDVTADIVQATAEEALRRSSELLKGLRDTDLAKHLGRMLTRRVDALPGRLVAWSRFDLGSTGPERQALRRADAVAYREEVRDLCRRAAQRNVLGNWQGATASEHAAGILLSLVAETGLGVDHPTKLAALHRATMRRIDDAHALGVAPVELRQVLVSYWRAALAERAAFVADYPGKDPSLPFKRAIAPLTHRAALQEVLELASLGVRGWVRLGRGLVGTVGSLTVPTHSAAEPAENMRERAPAKASGLRAVDICRAQGFTLPNASASGRRGR